NRPEWIMTDVAVQLCGAVLTPIYPTISPNELSFILNEAAVRIVFIAHKELYDRFKDALGNVPSIQFIFSFDAVDGVQNWQELVDKNLPPDRQTINSISENTLATIIYTS